MSRAIILPGVTHTITTHRDSITYAAKCQGCSWQIKGEPSPGVVQDKCMKHAGISNHRSFRMTSQGVLTVVREGER
ncbi:DUF7848 domain-containing protein [Streptomyces sp. NPDC002537]